MNQDRAIETQIPMGAMIWHKVTNQKMMVVGHATYIDGSTMIITNDGGAGSSLMMPELCSLDNPEFKSVESA